MKKIKKRSFLIFTFLVSLTLLFSCSRDPSGEKLEHLFHNPPDEAKPWVYWFWMDGNVTREGITADLEAMDRVGIGGVLIMGVGLRTPPGEADFNSPLWRELYRHAADECHRLGMKITLHQCDGWATAGGPWIDASRSIKMLVWSSAEVSGPTREPVQIEQPFTREDFYEDVAVIAVPVKSEIPIQPSMIKVNGKEDWSLFDGDYNTGVSGEADILVIFDTLREVSTVVFDRDERWPYAFPGMKKETWAMTRIEVSADGVSFDPVSEFDLNVSIDNGDHFSLTASFPPRLARELRIRVENRNKVLIPEIHLYSESRVHLWEVKSALARDREHGGETRWLDTAPWPGDVSGVIPSYVIDITDKLAPDGTLNWEVPPGQWRIIRAGMTSTGKHVAPRTNAGTGLEADKMSGEAIRFHFDAFARGMIDENNTGNGNPIYSVHTDSWESQLHTWSTYFAEEFEKRCGYSIIPWLPVLTHGIIIGSARESDRFLWDVRRTMADLIADNFYGVMREKCHESGVLFQSEAAGRQMFMYDPLNYAARTDIYVGEFWMPPGMGPDLRVDCKVAASAAHTYGRTLAGAEAFTSLRGTFQDDPFALKALGDQAFCVGINRFIIHRYCMQPFNNVKPGLTFGPYGINLERTQTWWEDGAKAWVEYLKRCQSLLQSGTFVADVIHYIGHDAPNYLGFRDELWDPVPPGYDYDGCNLEILKQLKVGKDGVLKLPSGMKYRLLLLPGREHMTLEAAREVERLVRSGATAVGPRPLRTPGLMNWEENDAVLSGITNAVWGGIDGLTVTENSYGKGRVIYGPSLEKILNEMVPPDFDYTAEEQAVLRYIHRQKKDVDFYFVANSDEEKPVDALLRFRVSGKAPELWDPSNGQIIKPAVYREINGVTELPVHFDPAGSWFVVFREKASPDALVTLAYQESKLFPTDESMILANGQIVSQTDFKSLPFIVFSEKGYKLYGGNGGEYLATTASGKSVKIFAHQPDTILLEGLWKVDFPPGEHSPGHVEFKELISWDNHPDTRVKYFSGTAKYKKSFVINESETSERVILDLGTVKNVATVKVNGQTLGILWKPPYRADVTGALRSGENVLEISVTNLWPNRLIGDEKLIPDPGLDYHSDGPAGFSGGPLRSIPDWVKEGGVSPVGRTTFVLWKMYGGDDPLLESGLIGPVKLKIYQ